MTFEIGQRVNVAPTSEEEAEHEIIGEIVEVLAAGYTGWYTVLLDNHLYGMDDDVEPIIEVLEDELTPI